MQEGRRLQVIVIYIDEPLYTICFLHNLFFNELPEFGRNQSTPPTSLQTVSGINLWIRYSYTFRSFSTYITQTNHIMNLFS